MSSFHDTLVLNKYMLSLFGIDSIGKRIIGKNGVEIFHELKYSTNEGYTEEGNTIYLQTLLNHRYDTAQINKDMLQQYDENIVRYTKEISEGRDELIKWKYFQYLSLLFTEIYLDKYFSNRAQLLAELNQFRLLFNDKLIDPFLTRNMTPAQVREIFQAEPFTMDSINKLAFWNATGSGKTLLMHVNIKQYMHYAEKYHQEHKTNVLLITPNEGLSKQHMNEFALSGIATTIFNKDSGSMFVGKEIEILEITKLAETSGDKTVAVESFETNNLVLIDEGHGGMSGDSWKRYRDQLSETGFAFEYSATFGQAISAANTTNRKLFTQEYAKSILFDYSYKYFYQDGYGKDYQIMNLTEDDERYRALYMTANLISFYQQMLIYKERGFQLRDFLLHKPLWVFVGGKVNAVRTVQGRQVSDVLEIIYFLTDFLKNPVESIKNINAVINNDAGLIDGKGYSIFETSFTYLVASNLSAEDIFRGINEEVFNNSVAGANLYLDNLKGVDGELGLRVGENDYFGVVNVGDETALYKFATDSGVLGGEKEFASSLFKGINDEDSTINLLIGAKKFTEGWSSWRVSSMGLMNVGRTEGSQIIQMFGRGVRLKGYGFSLKRSKGLDEFQKPDNINDLKKYLRHLETLQIFGVRADYMEQFKKFLEDEGLPTNDSSWITIDVTTEKKKVVDESRLKFIRVKDGEDFKRNILFDLELDLHKYMDKKVEVDWYPKIDVIQHQNGGVVMQKNETFLHNEHLALLDWNRIYLEIQKYKSDKTFYNLSIDLDELKRILSDRSWYTIYIPSVNMEFNSFENVFIWQELAEVLLKKYIEQFYLFEKNSHASENIEAIMLDGNSDNFVSQYDFRLNSFEDIEQYQQKIEELKNEVALPSFSKIQIANKAIAFDNPLHLYKPLVYLGKNYENLIKVSPIALNESEKLFLDHLIDYVAKNPEKLNDREVHVLRNQSKKGIGFFVDGNNFYPDFIVWVVKDDVQYIKFVDPKGIRNSRGFNDRKIQFHKVLKEEIGPQIADSNIKLDSFIVSNTVLTDVNWRGNATLEDFNKNNVYFQQENYDTYIEKILEVE